MKSGSIVASATLSALLVLAPGAAAQADEATASTQAAQAPRAAAVGTITAPVDGATFDPDEPITFQVSGLSTWQVETTCGDGTQVTAYHYSPTISVPSTAEEQFTCQANLYDDTVGWHDSISFTVLGANEIRRFSSRPTTFYPTVRDGFKDSVGFALSTRQDATVTMTVTKDGRTVRTARVHGPQGWDGYSRDWVSWNGKNSSGGTVPVGRYRVTFQSERSGLETATASTTVEVAKGWRTVRRSPVQDGWYDSRDETRGLCWTSQDYPRGNLLDCWGGAYAQATYTFRIPANARVTSWYANGRRHCCSNGRVIKTGVRTSPTSYRVRVRVTNWASFTVVRTGITYRARVPA